MHEYCTVVHLIAGVQDVLEVLAHAVVLNGEEDGVEDDAERHHKIEEGIVDDGEENVLGPEPALVVQAAGLTARTVTVVARLYKVIIRRSVLYLKGQCHETEIEMSP
jgi:hypothetical protein